MDLFALGSVRAFTWESRTESNSHCVCHNDDWILNIHFDIDSNDFFLSLSMCSRCCFFIRCFVFFVCNIGFLSVRHQHIIIRYFVLFRAYFDMHCSLTAKHTNQFIVAPGFEIYIPMFFFPSRSVHFHSRCCCPPFNSQPIWEQERNESQCWRRRRHSSIFV